MLDTAPAADPAHETEAAFGHIANILEHGAIAVMLSIGHKTALFETMATMEPATSGEIAEAAGLNERYVREWLAVMVTGRIAGYDPATRRYRLPPAFAACLTQDGAMGNMAVYAQFVGMAGAVQETVIDRFHNGEGIGYGDYPCFHSIMAEDSAQTVVAGIEDILQTLAPELTLRLQEGADMLDAGCGAGRAIIKLASLFPQSRFTGYDLCPDAIEMAQAEARRQGLANINFQVRDLAQLKDKDAFDLVTSFDAVHDTKDPEALLAAIYGALKPRGRHLMQDIGGSAHLENNLNFPFAPLLYAISCVHCTPVSLGQGGEGLGTMWGWETAERMVRNAGFETVTRTVLEHDPMNVWFVSTKQTD
ncbi:MAG TPA: class I SAM-dependent methyltransferase [Alphaproteobacteria bacterium]|nr:class I SAM-dependent methyltransferase [Alphaproteobacteria bacterium]